MFSIDFNPIAWIFLGIAFLSIIITLVFLWRPRYATALCRKEREEKLPESDETASETISASGNTTLPKASVILYASCDEDALRNYVDSLMQQDYPDFEIIIVYDSTAETAETISSGFTELKDKLYLTFLPPGSHNLSRHKLALTIGMKAAKGDVAVLTAANATLPSPYWLSSMMNHFINEKDVKVVLGYSHIDFGELHGIWKWYRQFDSVMFDSQWIGYALKGKPYRGNRYNLAFSRSLFFDHKGYAKTIFLENGDDDLFVNDICKGVETAVEVSPDSILTTQWGHSARRIWIDTKERNMFTSRWLPRAPFIQSGLLSFMQWLIIASLAGASLFGFPSLLPVIAALVSVSLFWVAEIYLYRSIASALQATRLWWVLPSFLLARPIVNFIFNIATHSRRSKNYTWRRS